MKEHHYKYLTISTYVNCTFILEFDRIRKKSSGVMSSEIK